MAWTVVVVVAASASAWVGCNTREVEPSGVPPSSPLAAARIETQEHVEAARRAVATGDYQSAVEQFTLALRPADFPPGAPGPEDDSAQDADILYQRGLAWLALGFPDTAAVDFSEVLRRDRDNAKALAKRGQAYLAQGDLYRATRDCTDAVRLEPDNAVAYRDRGSAYLGRGQFQRAIVDLEYAVHLDPTLEPQARPSLAKAYLQWSDQLALDGDDAAAVAKRAQARTLDPSIPAAAADESSVAATQSPAAAVTRTAAKPVLDEAFEHYRRARDLQSRRLFDEAIMEFTEAIAIDRQYADAYVRRAEALIAAGFPNSALKDLSVALRLDDHSVDACRLQARAFEALESYYRVVQSATEALHLDPGDASMYALRGRAYLEIKEPQLALADLEEAMRRSPELATELQPLLESARSQLESIED